jgi:hypothetical protein
MFELLIFFIACLCMTTVLAFSRIDIKPNLRRLEIILGVNRWSLKFSQWFLPLSLGNTLINTMFKPPLNAMNG